VKIQAFIGLKTDEKLMSKLTNVYSMRCEFE